MYVLLVVLFCVDRRHSVVIMSTDHCLSVVNHIIKGEGRLKECGLTTLETRRLTGDQIEVFKILNGYENIDRNIFVSQSKKREGLEDMELH